MRKGVSSGSGRGSLAIEVASIGGLIDHGMSDDYRMANKKSSRH